MKIRKFKENDINEVYNLFIETIKSVNSRQYNETQINKWIGTNNNYDKLLNKLNKSISYVAVKDNIIIGFANLNKNELDHLYVKKEYLKIGVGTNLLNILESSCLDMITTYASITAKSFFILNGFKVIVENDVLIEGVVLKNYFMRKDLARSFNQNID